MLEIICGGMFAGKSERLIQKVRKETFAKKKIQVFKPDIDTRYHQTDVSSHSGYKIAAMPIPTTAPEEMLIQRDGATVIGIDEIQFFSPDIVNVVRGLNLICDKVICAGLDLDSKGMTFGPMGDLMAMADKVHKINAVCTICGNRANRSQYLLGDLPSGAAAVGGSESYAARCLTHWSPA